MNIHKLNRLRKKKNHVRLAHIAHVRHVPVKSPQKLFHVSLYVSMLARIISEQQNIHNEIF